MTDLDRPRLHFTAPSGWINDPYGVTWREGRYQLFFQWHPAATEWSARMCWGQTDSPDLLRWSAPRVALAPSEDELGCWSGTVVMDARRPTLLYTSVGAAEKDRGRIVLARGDPAFEHWVREPGAVLSGPPSAAHFRDPYVWWAGDRWRMVVGAGLVSGAGAVLGYWSPDLRNWQFSGLVCSRPVRTCDPVWTGSVWECPQLFELDGAWVLVVSVAHEGLTRHIAYAVGDYDGSTFTALRWSRLMYGDSPYATTTFLDAAGRRCALSWLREAGPVADRDWAGALSLPLVLRRDDDRVIGAPHPNVDGRRTAITAAVGPVAVGRAPVRLAPVGQQSDVVLAGRVPPDAGLEATLLRNGMPVLALALAGDLVTMRRLDRPDESMPLGVGPDGRFELRLLLDAGIAEVFTTGGAGGVRVLPLADAGELVLTATHGRPLVERVTIHELA